MAYTKTIECITSKLNDDVMDMIKSFLYVNIPSKMTIDEAQFIIYINNKKGKELKQICKESKIKQSIYGVVNNYTKRVNIIEWYYSRNITDEEGMLINYLNDRDSKDNKLTNYLDLTFN